MAQPIVAVLGSLAPGREYRHPVTDVQTGVRACELVGAELARAGYDIVVYSSSPSYVEADVVRGYVSAATSASRVHVRAPHDQAERFAAPDALPELVVDWPGASSQWEIEFFRSLLAVDGVFLIGGGRATRTAGIIAAAQRLPLITVAAFGGGAREVWKTLENADGDLTADDRSLMGRQWEDGHARLMVASLTAQRSRRAARSKAESRAGVRRPAPETVGAVAALVLLVAAIAAVVGVHAVGGTAWPMTFVLAAPLCTAIAGALIRGLSARRVTPLRSAVVGLGAGLVSGLLYVATQFITIGDLADVDVLFRLVILVTPLGLIAGYTSDQVYASFKAPRIHTPQGVDPALEQRPL